MATLYYNNAIDTDWNTLGNWWTNSSFTTPASSLPTSADDVVVSANCLSNSGDDPTVNSMVVNGSSRINITITVNYSCIFNEDSYNTGVLNLSSPPIINGYNLKSLDMNSWVFYRYPRGVNGSNLLGIL
jgi:hypothetical protein